MAHTLSIVVVLHNSRSGLKSCLLALKESVAQIEAELIVVDNDSRDDSVALAKRIWPEVKVVIFEQNIGFAAAANAGAKIAKGEYLFFLNPDCAIESSAVRELLAVLTGNEKAGLVSGRLTNADRLFQPNCRRFPTLTNLLLSRGSVLGRFVYSHAYTLPDSEKLVIVPAVSATMAMMARSRFETIGGFDSRFFVYMEDTDLCLRLNRGGYENYFVPMAVGKHSWGEGSSSGRCRRRYYHHLSVWRYFTKHHRIWSTFLLLPLALAANFIFSCFLPSRKRP